MSHRLGGPGPYNPVNLRFVGTYACLPTYEPATRTTTSTLPGLPFSRCIVGGVGTNYHTYLGQGLGYLLPTYI